MNRQGKYPDTDTFIYYNANPHNRLTGDCVVRAISTVLNQSWERTINEMTEVGLKKGYIITDGKTIELYLESKGLHKRKQPRKEDNTKYTGKEFCKLLSEEKPNCHIVANIGGHHIVAIIDAKVHDTWNSTKGCIGSYWEK